MPADTSAVGFPRGRKKSRSIRMIPTRWFAAAIVSLGLPAAASSLLILNKFENTLVILDPADYHVIARVPTGDAPHEVVASTDGRFAFTSNYGTGPAPGNS